MSYVRKSTGSVVAAITFVTVLTAIAVWQFYLFVSFKGANGALDSQGGRIYLWVAIIAALLACCGSFFIFSAFLHHDGDDEIHITASPHQHRTKQL